MGYEDVVLELEVDGKVVYTETDPTLGGMAVSRDGRYLYVQRRLGDGRRQKKTYDLKKRAWLEDAPHPTQAEQIVRLTDFRAGNGDRLGPEGDGAMWTADPPFQLERPPRKKATELSDDDRRKTLEAILARPPSRGAWRDLLVLFEDWRGQAAEAAVARARSVVERWPEALRKAGQSMSWLAAHPAWELVAEHPGKIEMVGQPLGDEGAAQLVADPRLTSLSHLVLRNCAIGPAGAEALAQARDWTGVKWLSLADNPLGDAGARALAGAAHWTFLSRLDLRRCGIRLEAARDILYAPHFHYLTTLLLQGNPLGPPGVSILDGSRSSDLVRRLRRRTCAVHYTDGGRERVVKSVR
jgi:hypothetical protein